MVGSFLHRFLGGSGRSKLHQSFRRFQPWLERLKEREVPAVDLRMVTYNIAGDARTGLDDILEWIGNQSVNGIARPIDVLLLQEVNSNSSPTGDTQNVTNLLNGLYGAGTYAHGTLNGGTNGGGTQGIVYRVSSVDLIAETAFGTLSGSDLARQVLRYQLRPDGFAAGVADFYIYNSHMKANPEDAVRRTVEAQAIRTNADALSATADIIYLGDFNVYGSDEGAYTHLFTAGNGRAVDVANPAQNWTNNSSTWKVLYSQAPLQSPADGFSGGGIDDRFDMILMSEEANTTSGTPVGLQYRAGSYRIFGNNGSVAVSGNVNSTSNTALNFIADSTTRTNLLNYLGTVTDHLPVVADFYIAAAAPGSPTIGLFTIAPTAVTAGTPVTLTASNVTESGGSISAVNFYRETNGTAGLQIGADALVGGGTQNGTTWTRTGVLTSGLSAGTHTYYAVATGSTASTPASATLNITNSSTETVFLAWDVNGQNNFGPQGLQATQVVGGLTNSLGLTRGSGVATTNTGANNAWGGHGWSSTSATALTSNDFVTFGLTVNAGQVASLTSLDMYYRRSTTGPSSGLWQYQINGGTWTNIGDFSSQFPSDSTAGSAIADINLGAVSGLQNLTGGTTVTFRVVPYGGNNFNGTWYVYNQPGVDLVVNGTIAAAPAAPTVSSIVVNDGDDQRSRTTTVKVIFDALLDTALLTAPGAFKLQQINASFPTFTLTNASAGGILVSTAAVNGHTEVTLTFDSNVAGVDFGSLADGNWTLTVDKDFVKTTSGSVFMATDHVDAGSVTRLYGDVDGDGVVDINDLTPFGTTFGSAFGDDNFLAAFDIDESGTIDINDLTEFGGRFGLSL